MFYFYLFFGLVYEQVQKVVPGDHALYVTNFLVFFCLGGLWIILWGIITHYANRLKKWAKN